MSRLDFYLILFPPLIHHRIQYQIQTEITAFFVKDIHTSFGFSWFSVIRSEFIGYSKYLALSFRSDWSLCFQFHVIAIFEINISACWKWSFPSPELPTELCNQSFYWWKFGCNKKERNILLFYFKQFQNK